MQGNSLIPEWNGKAIAIAEEITNLQVVIPQLNLKATRFNVAIDRQEHG